MLLASPVLLCFLYFALFAARPRRAAELRRLGAWSSSTRSRRPAASSALTAYLVGAAAGILAGGFVAARTARHDLVAAAGLAVNALAVLLVAMGAVPGAALPLALALAGFAAGMVAPSRDLIVRASTPPGAAGRVFGFVYSGLDVGSFATPVFYGWMLDHGMPQGVFYAVFGLHRGARSLTVLQLPGHGVSPA